MTSERIASSLARPPALRITWASPSLEAGVLGGVEARVHAGEDGEAPCGWERELALVTEGAAVLLVCGDDLVEYGHVGLLRVGAGAAMLYK